PYGKQNKALFTGSAITIAGKEVSDQPRPSFQNSLQGMVPGLQVYEATGQPGAAPSVRIRGIGSFTGISTPLYVVDGVPMLTQSITTLAFSSNSGAGINPNDIESVTVLKDASATSIYGSQGANGVILITTKSGKSGRSKVELAANYGVNLMATTKRNRPLNTAEMTSLLIEGVINNTTNSATAHITNPEDAYEFLINQGLNPDIDTDWFDVITQRGQYAQYTGSVSGGNDKTSFYLSGGYYKQDAVTRGQHFERKTFRTSVNHKVSEKFKVSTRIGATMQTLSTIAGAGTGLNPVRSLYRLVPWISPYLENGDYNPAITYNPEMARRENIYSTNIYQLIGNVSAEYRFTDQLSFESRAAIDFHLSDDFRFWSPRWPDGVGAKGRGAEYSTTWNNWTINNLLKYRRQFGEIGFDATLGQEAGKRNLKRVSTQADNYAAEGLYTLANASTPYVAWSQRQAATIVSYFLNTSFDYQNKYFINATVRRDGSSRFGADVRFGNFWSVGAGWNIHEEEFFSPATSVVNQLKLRASYGLSGSQLGEYYGALGYYSTGQNYLDQPGIAIGQIESGNLMWEQNWPLDIGLEFTLLNSRISGTIDWYTRTTKKLFQDMPISYTNGRSNINFNVGSMKNYGIEISVTGQIVKPQTNNGFEWTANINFSTLNNKILEFQDSSVVQSYYLREIGGNFYQFYLRGYAGVERETGQALWFTDGTRKNTTTNYANAKPFAQPYKTALPRFFGGVTNTFSFKNLTLSTLVYYNWGNSVYDIWGQYTQSDGSAGVGEVAAMSRILLDNHWQKPGDNVRFPKIVYRGTQSGVVGQHSSRFLYDGSYIRLRDVTLTYNVPVKSEKPIFKAIALSLKASNLYTYVHDKYLPYDPEVGIDGLIDQNLPISKQFALGVNLTF
ncbi:MAG TPA: SusC/RagA family TonB-linked outer membrane protein, partial [Parasegetibacter sp.]